MRTKPPQVHMLKMLAAAVIALTGMAAGACTQTPVSPTSVAANAVLGDQGPLTAAAANSELLCHAQGNGTFTPLSVSPNAVGGHLGHGDGRPLQPAPGSSMVFTSSCELVASVAGTWLGESITFDPNSDPACGRDRNVYRLTLAQSGSEVSGDVYWKILESFYPPDVGMEQTVPLTSGTVSGNTFTFTHGPPQYGIVVTATFTDTTMTGTIAYGGSSCDANTFALVRQ